MVRRDYVAEEYYKPHNFGGRFKNNPDDNRLSLLERMHARTMTEMCANRFEWKGFPDSVNLRYLELTLFNHALAVVFEEPNIGMLALGATQSGQLNVYGDPLGFRVYSPILNRYVSGDPVYMRNPNRTHVSDPVTGAYIQSDPYVRDEHGEKVLDKNTPVGIPIWANMLRIPDMDIVYLYSTALAQLDRTIEINSINARRTKVFTVGFNQQMSAMNIEKQIQSGAATIYLNDAVNVDDMIKNIDLSVDPDGIEKLSILRARLKNQASELLGINTANQDKKERLVAAEVDANDEQVLAMRNVALAERQDAARRISKQFGLKISVDFRKAPEDDAVVTQERENA